MSVLSQKILNLPAAPGVYLFKDARGAVVYVGKARRLSSRVRSYLSGENSHPRLRELMEQAADVDVILTGSEVEALLLESTLVRQHKPRFNVTLKDDKSFPYVKISVQEEFPRLSVTRQVRHDGARYLGPFTDVKLLRKTLRELRRIFPVRTCRNFEDYRRADRPCLYFHIRRCVGPCTTRSRATPAEYRSLVEGLLLFLTGRDDELLRSLREDMERASAERRYEDAARRRDQIRLLDKVRAPQTVVARRGEADVLGVARHGRRAAVVILRVRGGRVVGKESRVLDRAGEIPESGILESFVSQHYLARTELPRRLVVRSLPEDPGLLGEALGTRAGHPVEIAAPARGRERRLVATAERNAALALEDLEARTAGRRARYQPEVLELQRSLGLGTPPYRIVCFDVSNLGPEGAVAAVVASENGRAQKSLYRRMRIRHPGPDDFAMISEAVERYWTRVESEELPRPDLVVVDGGLGQVRAARAALDRSATRPVALVGLAKREETVIRESASPLRLPRRSGSLQILQRVRDEAHRFGLTYHRRLRHKKRIASALDRIPGVGPARRAALLRAYGSVAAMREAGADELARTAGVPLAVAERVKAHLEGAPGETRPESSRAVRGAPGLERGGAA